MISTATVYSISHAAVRQNIGYTQRFIYGEITHNISIFFVFIQPKNWKKLNSLNQIFD